MSAVEPTAMPQWEYEEAAEGYRGWCHRCKDFTRDQTEPDAQGYDCPDCHKRTVMGAEMALISGLIAFTG